MEDQIATVVVCADDYGLAPGVNEAIASLITAGRLSATSCMSGLPDWPSGAPLLRSTVARQPADVGLHLTLTDQRPLTRATRLAPGERFPGLGQLLPRALARQLPADEVRDEIRAQLDAFEDAWGAPPDYVDGHQHMHLLPTVREALVEELLCRYPVGSVYARDCREAPMTILGRGVAVPKAVFLTWLGGGFARLARQAGIPLNQGFSGLHDFSGRIPFRQLMQAFLRLPGPRPLVHVHPGRVDATLRERDGLTTPREVELAYLASAAFAEDLAAARLRPGRFAMAPSP